MNNHTRYEGKVSKTMLPLALILAIIPLVVRLREVKLPEVTKEFWDTGSGTYADFFSANKVVVLGILVMIGVVLFATEYIKALPYKNTKLEMWVYRNKVVYILMGSYTILAILSTITAKSGEKSLAFFGAPGRYEGLVAILFYMISMFLAMQVANEWWNIKLGYKFLVGGALVLGLIGIFQFFGFDFFQTDGGKALILPFKYQHLADQINFAFAGRVYGTLFNPNYVGSYAAMLMPISIVGMLYTYLYNKDNSKKIYATLFALIMVIFWIVPYSRGGLVGGLVALLLSFILLRKKIITKKVQWLVLAVLLIVPIVAFNIFSKGYLVKRISTLPKEIVKLFSSSGSDIKQLEWIELGENSVEITSNLPVFKVTKEGEEYTLQDETGNAIPTRLEENKIIPEDERFNGLLVVKQDIDKFHISVKNPEQGATYGMNFVQTAEGVRIEGSNGQLQTVERIPAWGFKGKEKVGSSRGYIWSRTLPMVKDTWLLGYGPDTYVVRFPQHDIIGKIIGHGTPRIVVDKPHNLYLQTMVSTGLVSLLVLAALFVVYVGLFIKHLRMTDRDDIRRWMSIGIFVSLCGYLVAGFFNDSVVSVAPVFWILWGLGIGLTSSVTQLEVVKNK